MNDIRRLFFWRQQARFNFIFLCWKKKKTLKKVPSSKEETSFNQLRDFEKDSSLSYSLASLPIIAPTAGSAQTL